MQHDADTSYFARTFWFIWIGFVTSLVSFVFMGFVNHATTENFAAEPPEHQLILVFSALTFFISWFLEKKILGLNRNGDRVVWYVVRLGLHEFVAAFAFIRGFLAHDFKFMLPYIAFAMILNLWSLPTRFIRKGAT